MTSVQATHMGTNECGIDQRQVLRIASRLRTGREDSSPSPERWDNPDFWNVEASRNDRCQFLAVGNTINFRFWSLQEERVVPARGVLGGTEYRGSMYLWRRLRLGVARQEISLDATFLASLTEDKFTQVFTDDDGKLPLEPGLSDRVANLIDLGTKLEEEWDGQFANLIDASRGSLNRYAKLCTSFRAFDDPVQKLTMVNAIMLTGSGLASFDPSPYPGVDYHLVKQAARQGLIEPTPSTRSKLVNGQLLTSEESLALRTATLQAVRELAHHANISTSVIDNLYWLNRRICGETQPDCPRCPFESACIKRTELGIPLEFTRYY